MKWVRMYGLGFHTTAGWEFEDLPSDSYPGGFSGRPLYPPSHGIVGASLSGFIASRIILKKMHRA